MNDCLGIHHQRRAEATCQQLALHVTRIVLHEPTKERIHTSLPQGIVGEQRDNKSPQCQRKPQPLLLKRQAARLIRAARKQPAKELEGAGLEGQGHT